MSTPGEIKTSAAETGFHLTPRQLAIVGLLASGLSDKEIATRLGVSPHTVRSHLDRLFREHGFRNRTAAVAAWLELGNRANVLGRAATRR